MGKIKKRHKRDELTEIIEDIINRKLFYSGDEVDFCKTENKYLLRYATKTDRESTFVYLMECNGFYKIGFASKPKKRKALFQTGNPHKITLVAVSYPLERTDAEETEDALHRIFKHKHVRGEWFDLDETSLRFVLYHIQGGELSER